MRNVVPLQRLEQRQLDFGLLGDREESNVLLFTPLAQPSAETVMHAAHLSRATKHANENVALGES
jgi:hypothetical protein